MKKIDVIVYPYRRKGRASTLLYIDEMLNDNPNNRLSQFVSNQPMAKWLKPYRQRMFVWNGFLSELMSDLNESEYRICFHGDKNDYEFFSAELSAQKQTLEQDGRRITLSLSFTEGARIDRAITNLSAAFSQLSERAYALGDFDQVSRIAAEKEKLQEVPSAVLSDTGEDLASCASVPCSSILKIRKRRPRFVLQLIEQSETEDAVVQKILSVLQEYNCVDCLAILISDDCPIDRARLSQKLRKNEQRILSLWKETYLLSFCGKDQLDAVVRQYLDRCYFPQQISLGLDALDDFLAPFEGAVGLPGENYITEAKFFADKLFLREV